MATLMCVRCDTGAPRCLSVLTAEKRDFPAQVREDGPCQDSRPKGPFCVYGPALGGVLPILKLWALASAAHNSRTPFEQRARAPRERRFSASPITTTALKDRAATTHHNSYSWRF